ncbi:hypothetical protein EYB53_006045 [Candidatus Chloroploca sp. M-50]|uniref:Kazal-like domain-containing protein n=1 Tax=Candidatus Chloroploca mongolica TaxID=2528176 RepID=A0ABS4D752_9CHLR|nr:hypothetical protein [Candidatus Chloroploca mongolica]
MQNARILCHTAAKPLCGTDMITYSSGLPYSFQS